MARSMKSVVVPPLTIAATLLLPAPIHGQAATDLAVRLAGLTAVTGFERAMVDTLLASLPAARRDRAGNAVLVLGRGEPRRLAACALDEPGYVVGGVRDDGYLTLRRVGPAPGPLYDQQLEGHRVTVFGRNGPVPGVVAVRSVHLSRGRGDADAPFTVDSAYVDLGAASAAEVGRLGVELLAPVALAKKPHRYGDGLLAAPVAAARGACAALLAAARRRSDTAGTTVVAFVVEGRLGQRGLLTVANAEGPFQATLALGFDPPAAPGLGTVTRWALGTRYAGTAVETISLGEVEALARRVADWLGGAE
ncbi:MAG TPA: hypothetical protein VNK43_02020 [Gemmatimonadales bacterium]|nr:hypothetical protein [Gemmatimonadales bacterium]